MTIFPKDAGGTEFDPAIHNLLNDTATPQLSQKGNYVRLRPSESNPTETINLFLEGLIGAVPDDVIAELAGEPDVEITASLPASDISPAIPEPEIQAEEDAPDIAIEDESDFELTAEELASDDIIIEDDPDTEEEDVKQEVNVKPQKVKISSYKGELSPDLIMQIQDQARALDTRADFSKGYNLTGINLAAKDIRAAIFKNCNLDGANFEGANLMGVNFIGASVKGTNFKGACLKFAILSEDFKSECLIDENTDFKGAA